MNRQTIFAGCSTLLLSSLLAACTYLPVSSAGTGFKLAERTSAQIERSKREIAEGVTQLDATMATLSQIMIQPEQDARGQWAQLDKDIERLEKQVQWIDAQNERMRQQADIYFQSWDTELAAIANTEMQQRSRARRSEQMAQYEKTQAALSDARSAFDPLFADLKDMRKYLSIDLTPASRTAVSDLHDQARQNAREVKLAVSRGMDELNRMQSVLSPGEAPQGAA